MIHRSLTPNAAKHVDHTESFAKHTVIFLEEAMALGC